MQHIVAGVLSLVQHITQLKTQPYYYRPACCLSCGKAGLWMHGSYPRKSDRSGELNPVFIPRFFCPCCHKTCSVLPECIPPTRWYLWEVQQVALLFLLAGKSAYAIAKELTPSRHTISRWFIRFKEQFHLHKDVLCFWQMCLNEVSLATAMRLCHVTGVFVP